MKREAMISLSAAVLSLAFFATTAIAETHNNSSSASNSNSSAQLSIARSMVPAQAELKDTLDARKVHSGQQFEATLNHKVTLKDGQELPAGTVLVGKVVTDAMHAGGSSKLALRITQAKLNDGKAIPIHAMIAGIYSQGSPDAEYGPFWSPSELNIEQLGATGGFDLHSQVDGKTSGTFESKKKDDVKLNRGVDLSLAIAPAKGMGAGSSIRN